VAIAERVLEGYREDRGLSEGLLVREVLTLDMLEYLQDRLLAGDECRYDVRSPNTVNSMMGAVMAFVRFCSKHDWIDKVPDVPKLEVDDVMKGRPITTEEFERMLAVTPTVVGKSSAASWQFALSVLWESAFRIGDLMDFSWDDERHIHPVWPSRKGHHPTLVIPSTQKNGQLQEIPMLPGLQTILDSVPTHQRTGWVVNPQPMEYEINGGTPWFRPTKSDLQMLVKRFSNSAIARLCGVSETTIRNWVEAEGIRRAPGQPASSVGDVPSQEATGLQERSLLRSTRSAQWQGIRLTKERTSRVISMIGQDAGIVVRKADESARVREKFASAHDLRRGCARRLINSGVSAETLKVVMRHKDFATTEKHYGAFRSAQAAADEVRTKLAALDPSFVGGLVGGKEEAPQLSAEELLKLKSLLNSL
jgi:integrase